MTGHANKILYTTFCDIESWCVGDHHITFVPRGLEWVVTDVRRQKVQNPCVQNSRSRIFSRLELRAAFTSSSVPFLSLTSCHPALTSVTSNCARATSDSALQRLHSTRVAWSASRHLTWTRRKTNIRKFQVQCMNISRTGFLRQRNIILDNQLSQSLQFLCVLDGSVTF